jgi:hypothetical protein
MAISHQAKGAGDFPHCEVILLDMMEQSGCSSANRNLSGSLRFTIGLSQ